LFGGLLLSSTLTILSVGHPLAQTGDKVKNKTYQFQNSIEKSYKEVTSIPLTQEYVIVHFNGLAQALQ